MATDKPSDDSNKKEPIKQDSEESPLGSSPDGEGDGEPADSGEQGQALPTPEGQAPKRKGGRKPVREYLLACFASSVRDSLRKASREGHLPNASCIALGW